MPSSINEAMFVFLEKSEIAFAGCCMERFGTFLRPHRRNDKAEADDSEDQAQ